MTFNQQLPVVVSWWTSPVDFYIQPKDKFDAYTKMMNEIQKFYASLPSISTSGDGSQQPLQIGTYVVCRFAKDQLFYRACVLDYRDAPPHARYKVLLCDVGNRTAVQPQDVWQLAQQFSTLERLAIRCALPKITDFQRQDLEDKIDRYLHASMTVMCEFLEPFESNSFYVRIETNGRSLRDSLINDQMVSVAEVQPITNETAATTTGKLGKIYAYR